MRPDDVPGAIVATMDWLYPLSGLVVGAGEQRRWHVKAERFGRFEVDDQYFFTEISFAAMIASLASRWRRKRITKSFQIG